MVASKFSGLLEQEIAALAEKLEGARMAIRAARREYRRVEIEIGALKRLQDRAAGIVETEHELPRPRAAVLEYVRLNPGCRPAAIVAALMNGIRTTSAEPEKLLQNTINQLERSGRLKKSLDGNLYLGDESSEKDAGAEMLAAQDESATSGQPENPS